MLVSELDFHLPAELIAQHPAEPRDSARLLSCAPTTGAPVHGTVSDLDRILRPGDLLVLNRTRVFPARLPGTKTSGGAVEVLLIHAEAGGWRAMIRGAVRPGAVLRLAGDIPATVVACHADGTRTIALPPDLDVIAHCEAHGQVPLPPYIRRAATTADRARYQSVFADRPGSVAAPTASLHLTTTLLERLARRGVERATVELAIGPGTFKPIDTDQVEAYRIHAEWCACPPETVAAIAATRARGGRVVAVGTTVVRTLETAADQPGGLAPWSGWTTAYLHPPRRLVAVDGLLTNFHLPRSSLLLLVACLTGLPRLRDLYAEAIAARYRFFSYGDAMLLLDGASDPSPA
jgi:S-adenosylmethionine:tRNA ribosyltransferase-isomerase